jgi:hypothetical protein
MIERGDFDHSTSSDDSEHEYAPARSEPVSAGLLTSGQTTTSQTSSEEMVAAALASAERGWHVFPAPPGQKKSHKGAKFSGGRKWGATRDPDEIQRDWRRWPNACIGITTGRNSGFFVVELDTPAGHNVDGIAAMKQLEDLHGKLPETLRAISPSGSLHYYFQYPEGVEVRNSTSRVGPGIDVRGEGGMVIAPPSNRPGKGVYRWDNDYPIAAAPQWLLEKIRSSTTNEPSGAPGDNRPAPTLLMPQQMFALESSQAFGSENVRPGDVYAPATLEAIQAALAAIDPDCDRETWFAVGCALFGERGEVEGMHLWDAWSRNGKKYPGESALHDQWISIGKGAGYSRTIGTLFFHADRANPAWRGGPGPQEQPIGDEPKLRPNERPSVTLEDFYAYMPAHNYIYVPTRELWPSSSVNARIGKIPVLGPDGRPLLNTDKKPKTIDASTWLDKNRPVEQMIWVPGEPELIRDRLLTDGGWVLRTDARAFNLYRPPSIGRGDAASAKPWVDHIRRVYGDQADHLISWFAHRVQRPGEKINHAIVLGGEQGVGKDTILEAVKYAVGPWNFAEVSPQQMMGRFNGFIKSVVMRISEAPDEGSEVNRYQFYEHLKTLAAAPPDVLRCDEKNLREHYVFNATGVIITTNHKASGIFLPSGDRRHYVAWSDCELTDFDEDYWKKLWGWYYNGGLQHVAAYLAELDISSFNPKAPPPKTAAFWDIVDANRPPEEAELADVFEKLENPPAVTIAMIKATVPAGDNGIGDWIRDRRNRRAIPHRLHEAGYDPVRNPDAKDGMWKIGDARCVVYSKRDLPVQEQIRAAQKVAERPPSKEAF